MAWSFHDNIVARAVRILLDPMEYPERELSKAEKFAAKRANELTKATAALFNNLAVGTIIAGVLSPLASGHEEPFWGAVALLLVALVLHLVSRATLHFLKRED